MGALAARALKEMEARGCVRQTVDVDLATALISRTDGDGGAVAPFAQG